jgi:hypothetical protein
MMVYGGIVTLFHLVVLVFAAFKMLFNALFKSTQKSKETEISISPVYNAEWKNIPFTGSIIIKSLD